MEQSPIYWPRCPTVASSPREPHRRVLQVEVVEILGNVTRPQTKKSSCVNLAKMTIRSSLSIPIDCVAAKYLSLFLLAGAGSQCCCLRRSSRLLVSPLSTRRQGCRGICECGSSRLSRACWISSILGPIKNIPTKNKNKIKIKKSVPRVNIPLVNAWFFPRLVTYLDPVVECNACKGIRDGHLVDNDSLANRLTTPIMIVPRHSKTNARAGACAGARGARLQGPIVVSSLSPPARCRSRGQDRNLPMDTPWLIHAHAVTLVSQARMLTGQNLSL